MRQYSNNEYGRTGGLDTSELDPCIAAESRMKKSVISSKMKRLMVLLGVLLLLLLVLGLLAFVLTLGSSDSIDYEEHEASIEPFETGDVRMMQQDEGGMFGEQSTTYAPLPHVPIIRPTTITTMATLVHIPRTTTVMPTKRPIVVRIPVETTTDAPSTSSSTTTTTTTTSSTTTTTTKPPTTTTTTPAPTTPKRKTVATKAPSSVHRPGYYQPLESSEPMTADIKRDCLEHRESELGSGVYHVSSDGVKVFDVFCDMETDGGGWTVVQRRVDGKLAFYNRTYKEYEDGFGQLTSSHWLGLSSIGDLAPMGGAKVELRIELRGDTCDTCSHQPHGYWWGEWDFALGDARSRYQLHISPSQIRGNLSMPGHDGRGRWETMSNGQPFTAIDKDNDSHSVNCAQFRNYGGWWHRDCTVLALNGVHGDNRNKLRYLVYLYETPHEDGKPTASYHIHPRQTVMMIRSKY